MKCTVTHAAPILPNSVQLNKKFYLTKPVAPLPSVMLFITGLSNAWTILSILKTVSLDSSGDVVSEAVIGQLVDLTTDLAKDSKDQEYFRGRIHPVK